MLVCNIIGYCSIKNTPVQGRAIEEIASGFPVVNWKFPGVIKKKSCGTYKSLGFRPSNLRSYCTFVPPRPPFLLIILVQNFMLIKNHIQTRVWKSTDMKLLSLLKFFKILKNHHKKRHTEHTTMLNITQMSIRFLCSICLMQTWFLYAKRQKT